PPRLEEGAEEAVSRAPGQSREALEVFPGRHRRARALERLYVGIRRRSLRHQHGLGAMVRRSRRSEVGHARDRRGLCRDRDQRRRPELPGSDSRDAREATRSENAAGERVAYRTLPAAAGTAGVDRTYLSTAVSMLNSRHSLPSTSPNG